MAALAVSPATADTETTGNLATNSPNIVLIVADDLGYDQTTLYGRPGAIRVPSLAGLADEGVRLTNGYVASPVCSPSRSALLTGQEPARVGADSNWQTRVRKERMPTDTIAAALPEKYRSIAIGKWDLAGNMPFHRGHLPDEMGFDDFYGFQGGLHAYCEPAPGETNLVRYDPTTDGYQRVAAKQYLTDDFTQHAVDYINEQAPTAEANPFFMYLAYNAPHDPFDTPTTCAGHQQPESQRFHDMVQILDDGIGRVRHALRRSGLADNTLVVFMSDNGQQYEYFTGPTRGGKYTLFEGGVKVPMTMSWPGVLPRDSRYDQPVSSLDLYPTLLAATQGNAPAPSDRPGVDLRPHLTGQVKERPHERLSWRYVVDRAVGSAPGIVQGTVIEAQRSKDYKWVRSTEPPDTTRASPETRTYLFDLADNPHEHDSGNLWGDNALARPLLVDHHAWNRANATTESFEDARAANDVRAGLPDSFIEDSGSWTTVTTDQESSYQGTTDGGTARSVLELSWYDDATTDSTLRLTEPGRAGVIVRGSGAAEDFDGYVAGLAVPQDGSSCAGGAPQPGGGSSRVYLAKVQSGVGKVVGCAEVPISLDTDHTIEIAARGNDLQVSLGGVQQIVWTDTSAHPFRGGRIGLEVGGHSSTPTVAEFGALNSLACASACG